ncbi:hypothetical protein BDN72DRAFT_761779 [Pluteus cervinus]|uniref:Uncharacterized protein n=1 Tax=Pluteus cervinus TaxID=181527 RepID=A0ACD3B6X6_9AGAR|nr:hypothetical protein BDN72DRAFT_761779 [Pluteus cervinus]
MPRKDDTVLDDLLSNVSSVFDQAQSSLANHRKNCVALCKLHHQASKVKQKVKNGTAVKLVGEKAFGDAFIDMLNRVLVVKKGPPTADRIVKFIGSYVKFLNDKGQADDEEEEETLATRFASRLLKWLIQGFGAKDKTVRYRSVFVVSDMITHLGELDEDMYDMLREGVLDRMNDKEPLVRIHAAIALSKLVGSEDPDEVQEGEATILEVLLDAVEYDPAADVRRAALLNVPLTQASLPAILSRTRDTEAVTRKLVYSSVLKSKLQHPRQLILTQRERIVKDGLGDREPGVRLAAGKMIASWFDAVVADEDQEEQDVTWEGDEAGVMKGFVRFLALFDVVGPGQVIAVDAVLSIFVTRPDLLDSFIFPESYWRLLTPESAVLARVFIEHSFGTQSEANVEHAALPVVTAFAFHIQNAYNTLLRLLQEVEAPRFESTAINYDEVEAKEEELAKQEVVLGELLRMALQLDYMDEIGRRKVFTVVRDMIAHPALPPGLIERCLDVLREITPSERELIRLVVEVVIELRDNDEENQDPPPEDNNDGNTADTTQTTIRRERSLSRIKDRQQMSADERMDADMADMRCLLLCIGVLERVNGNFEDNSTLEGVLADLIIPSVRRKELPMREKGLVSLGLCCLIAKNMAFSSFQLFVNQVEGNPPELQLQVLKVILDLLITYEQDFFGRSEETAQQITVFLLRMLEVTESASVRATVCVGLSKLLLSGVLTDERVLISLLALYVSPETVDNQELRQCLAYFFPVYFYSSPDNQNRLVGIFAKALKAVTTIHDDLEDGQQMISPYQFGQLMVDWTNPQKVASR